MILHFHIRLIMDDVRPDKYTWRAHIFVLPTYHLIIYLFYESATICDI